MHITILCAPGGSGHIQAAKALQAHAQTYQDITVSYIDISSFFPTYINHLVFDSYNWSARYTPFVWGQIYRWTNNRFALNTLKLIVWCTSHLYKERATALIKQIQQYNPDWIICTHPVARLFVPKKSSANIGMIITDYGLHSSWVSNPTDMFFVPTEHMIPELLRYTVSADHCVISGIPVHPVFFEQKNIQDLQQKYSIDTNKHTCLILTGGQGMYDPSSYIFELNASPRPLNIIVIAGKNDSLKEKLESITLNSLHTYHVIGWTEMVDEYMHLADSIITKPGGITVTECLTLQKPMILISPIPGQEEANCRVFCDMGAAVYVKKPADILHSLNATFATQKKLPNASQIILQYLTNNTL